MPPKKKGKKVDDDWEAELGETVPGAEATDGDATPGESAVDQNGDDAGGEGGGSLMAALQKNRNKRQKKGKHVEEIVGTEEAEPELDNLPLRPADGSKGENGVKEAPKAGAKGQAKKAPPTEEEAGKVKTKKEKEKEKKEREKQKKKEQAAKKKPTAATTSAASKDEEPEAAEPEAADEAEAAATAASKAAASKRKIPAGLAALRKKQEELKQREEELARLNAEEKARAEEEEKRLAEEEKKKEEARARKKEKEKEKKEQLKKEGKLLTPAQKAAKERNERAREQMLASGGLVAGLQGDAAEEKKKKPVYDKKKRPTKKELDEKAAIEAAQEALRKEAEQLKRKEKEEAAEKAKKDAELAAANEESDDDVKESWDMDSDEEREHKQATAVAAATAATAAAAKRAEEESDSDSEESEDEETSAAKAQEAKRKAEAAARRQKQHEAALAARSKDNLRSPICCILGHVDTGKTKLLDKIRQTNVQEGEAGGITQQIGATYFPAESIKQKVAVVNPDNAFEFKVPGLLVIDTPGHESFTNLRSRGSSLCNIAVLVVDIMHGLEPQTIESIKLLRDRKTPFIVALNKIDRLYGWKPIANNGFEDSLSKQNKGVHNEFRDRLEKTKVAFAEQGFNSELFFENKSLAKNVSLVPTSAHTGEGIPDMLKLLIMLTQERMTNKLMYLSEVECTVLEVKVIEGLGTTIDVVLSNGVLREGDRIVICGLQGAIATNIRALLTPPPARELRIKSQYIHHKEVKASLGVKIAANDLENAIAGSRLLVVGPDDDEEDLEEEVMSDLDNLLSRVSTTGRGVSVHASTLGSLEALLEFLRVSKIPVANISIGTVWKRDVMQAGVMLEKAKEYAVMLCFDVKVDKEAQQYADDVGIKIFTAPIIYHLFDAFTAHMKSLAEQRKEESKLLAVFPCVLSPVAVFNKKDPIVLGVDVVEGNLRLTTPVAVVKTNPTTGKKEVFSLGRVVSIERDHKQINICKRGQPSVAIKIEGPNQPGYGRQLEDKDMLFSQISRLSIDTLKEFYRDEVTNDEWLLVKKLKGTFDIA